MAAELFPLKKALQIFGRESGSVIESQLPPFARSSSDNRRLKSWSLKELPAVGEQFGFIKKPKNPVVASIFVTKGGVLKSTLTLNIARMAALHDIRTCVVGLDMQGDITAALTPDEALDENEDSSLADAIEKIDALQGLPDVFTGEAKLEDVVLATDIPTLFYIPETPELVALDQSLTHRNRREYWLEDFVASPLKKNFDLILLDCSPNWNRLITNALVACDVLISPLECKINNFRNFKTFQSLLSEFKRDMHSQFSQVFVPTRLSPARKLSREIFSWYQENLENCAQNAIRESIQGEEAMAMRISIPEYAPTSAAADEIRALLQEIWPVMIAHETKRAFNHNRKYEASTEASL